MQMLKREIEIMKICKHPNTVRMFDYFENDNYLFIVIEFLKGGDLINYFEQRGYSMSEQLIANLMI